MRTLIPLSLVAALTVAPAIADEEEPAEPPAPAIDAPAPLTIDEAVPNTESPAAPESDVTAQTSSATDSQEAPAEDAAPQETVSESQE